MRKIYLNAKDKEIFLRSSGQHPWYLHLTCIAVYLFVSIALYQLSHTAFVIQEIHGSTFFYVMLFIDSLIGLYMLKHYLENLYSYDELHINEEGLNYGKKLRFYSQHIFDQFSYKDILNLEVIRQKSWSAPLDKEDAQSLDAPLSSNKQSTYYHIRFVWKEHSIYSDAILDKEELEQLYTIIESIKKENQKENINSVKLS